MAVMDALLKIRADVQGEGQIESLGRALGGLNKTAASVSGGLRNALSGLGNMGGVFGALAGAATGAGLMALGKSAIDAADNLRDMSIRTGVSVERLSQLKTAAEMSGATIDDVGKALTKTAVAIANSTSAAASATAAAVTAGTGKLQLSIADQLQMLERRDQQQVALIKSNTDRQVQAVRDGEQRQVDALELAKDRRIAVLQRESDARMGELNRRYRQEEKLLNDSFSDKQDAERRQADDEQNRQERAITRRYDLRRKAIQDDQVLSATAKDQALQALSDEQDAELTELRRGFEEKAKARGRYYRDQQEAAQQAIDVRRTKEQQAEQAATAEQRRLLEERTKGQKEQLARASTERIAIIKQAAESQIRAIEDGNKRASDAYAKLGISLRNANGSQRNAGDVFLDVFDALQKLPTAADRASAAFDIYGGKLAGKLLPLFAMTRKEVEALVPTFSTDFANAADSSNDKLTQLSSSMSRLGAAVATILLPAINPLVDVMDSLVSGFTKLPQPLQAIIGGVVALAAAFVVLTPVITTLATGFAAIEALNLGGLIAGWLPVIAPAIAGIITAFVGLLTWIGGTLIPGLLAFFSGPVGWTVLAVAAVVAMVYAFREPIGKFLVWVGGVFTAGLKALYAIAWQLFVQPWINLWNLVLRKPITDLWNWFSAGFQLVMQRASDFVQRVWQGMINTLRMIVNGFFKGWANGINFVIGGINKLIGAFNRLPGPDIGFVPTVPIPQFAQGGVADRRTLAWVGDGGEREYIVPESKMAAASAAFLGGARGASVIPSGSSGGGRAPVINVTTGPVMEFDGQRYVRVEELERAMRVTAEGVMGRLRTPAARVALGMR